jgi:hypothetical protein
VASGFSRTVVSVVVSAFRRTDYRPPRETHADTRPRALRPGKRPPLVRYRSLRVYELIRRDICHAARSVSGISRQQERVDGRRARESLPAAFRLRREFGLAHAAAARHASPAAMSAPSRRITFGDEPDLDRALLVRRVNRLVYRTHTIDGESWRSRGFGSSTEPIVGTLARMMRRSLFLGAGIVAL